jgi:hydroxymethylbilane synthase
MTASASLIIGTRGSPLALAQAHEVQRRLADAHPDLRAEGAISIRVIKTTGDMEQTRLLSEIGGKGLFTKEIEDQLLSGEIHLAVHSMKDVPTVLPDGLGIVAVLEREDPRDALIGPYRSLAEIPAGATIGTASLRRGAQALHVRPDLTVVPLRGNVDTRLRKVREGQVAASFLAMAGLNRLGLTTSSGASPVSVAEMLPATAQGAVGIEARLNDSRVLSLLAAIDHHPTHICVRAERAMLAVLDGNCRTPIGGLAVLEGERLTLDGAVISPDGRVVHRLVEHGFAEHPETLGRRVGERLKAKAS